MKKPKFEPGKSPHILIPEAKLQTRVKELAQQINQDYVQEGIHEIVAICVLKGSFIFYCDLIRQMDLQLSCEFLGISSYGSEARSSGEVKVTLDINEPLENRHVLVIEDIVDSGLSLNYIVSNLRSRNPASIKTAALLVKPETLKTPLEIDYVGFRIDNEFVVGYGIDYAQKFRGLPYIGYLANEH